MSWATSAKVLFLFAAVPAMTLHVVLLQVFAFYFKPQIGKSLLQVFVPESKIAIRLLRFSPHVLFPHNVKGTVRTNVNTTGLKVQRVSNYPLLYTPTMLQRALQRTCGLLFVEKEPLSAELQFLTETLTCRRLRLI